GDDEQLGAACQQQLADLEREALELLGAALAVGEARRVAEVEEILVWQLNQQLLQHGEPADTGVEHGDRTLVGRVRGDGHRRHDPRWSPAIVRPCVRWWCRTWRPRANARRVASSFATRLPRWRGSAISTSSCSSSCRARCPTRWRPPRCADASTPRGSTSSTPTSA